MTEHCDTCNCHDKKFGILLNRLDHLTYWRKGKEPIPSWTPLPQSAIKLIVDDYRERLGRKEYLKLVPDARWD